MGWDLLLTSQTNGLDFNKAILRVRTINLLEVRMRIILKVNRLWFEVKRGVRSARYRNGEMLT